MKLPNSDQAYIEPQKLSDYLLSEDHPQGQAKAQFFRSIGFDHSNVATFEERLLHLARTEIVTATQTTPHGEKYVIEGSLTAPDGYWPRFVPSG